MSDVLIKISATTNTENIAAGKNTIQSSTFLDGTSGRALDGNPDTVYENGSCSHTLGDNPSWWRVDLGSSHVPVSEVHIVNRFSSHVQIRQRNEDYKITLGKYFCSEMSIRKVDI